MEKYYEIKPKSQRKGNEEPKSIFVYLKDGKIIEGIQIYNNGRNNSVKFGKARIKEIGSGLYDAVKKNLEEQILG